MFVSYLVPRTGLPTPGLQNATVAMTAGTCVGSYTFYNASFSIPGGMSYNARIDITSGTGSSAITDGFNAASEFAGSCESFSGAASCSSVAISSVSSTATSTQSSATSVPASSGSSIVSTTATTTAAVTPTVKATLPGYNFVSCWTEASSGRALKEASFAYDGMTLESCMANCTGYNYWGTEYGRYCIPLHLNCHRDQSLTRRKGVLLRSRTGSYFDDGAAHGLQCRLLRRPIGVLRWRAAARAVLDNSIDRTSDGHARSRSNGRELPIRGLPD